jgi:hypothetical protein
VLNIVPQVIIGILQDSVKGVENRRRRV